MSSKKQKLIVIDQNAAAPIYKQIVASIKQAVVGNKLSYGSMIPSVAAVTEEFGVARGSVFKAYNELRALGVIDSVPGKGYFVSSTRVVGKSNIFLLMSTFNPYREVFYEEFVKRLKKDTLVDMYFHHHNIRVFETLIRNHAANYNTFIVMPEPHKQVGAILKRVDTEQLYLLDVGLAAFGKLYPGVYQDYEQGMFHFLQSVYKRIKHYKRTVLLFSTNMRNYELITGFENFAIQYNVNAVVIKDTALFKPERGDLCIALDDADLVRLMRHCDETNWLPGTDLGIISYNETPLKSVVAKGISTIGPDFRHMGISMAAMVCEGAKEQIINPFLFKDRASF